MGDIAKGALGGAWSLLVGWVLPTALNLAVLFFAVAPSVRGTAFVDDLWPESDLNASLLLLAGAVTLGLTLNALQTPLYRFLEGYVLWPSRLHERGCARQLGVKRQLRDRRDLLRLERLEAAPGPGLPAAEAAQLAALRAATRLRGAAVRDRRRSAAQRALLGLQLARYPHRDAQVAATRLGNAIRRFEEFGHDRFRLDTQVMWHELTGAAPEQVVRQVTEARAGVDFFVALLYGQAAVAVAAAAATAASDADVPVLAATAVVLAALVPVWYRAAVAATDEWAMTVQALVNIGRKPLAEALGLALPATLAEERAMWELVVHTTHYPYRDPSPGLDRFRAEPPASPPPFPPPFPLPPYRPPSAGPSPPPRPPRR